MATEMLRKVIVNGVMENIMEATTARVITYESARRGAWYHPSKVVEVLWSENLGRFVTVPK